jgi:hypothetical protein
VTQRDCLFEAEEIQGHKDTLTRLVKESISCVLIGNKLDLRDTDSISLADIQAMAMTVGCKLSRAWSSARTMTAAAAQSYDSYQRGHLASDSMSH